LLGVEDVLVRLRWAVVVDLGESIDERERERERKREKEYMYHTYIYVHIHIHVHTYIESV